jgi:hypothetical protein
VEHGTLANATSAAAAAAVVGAFPTLAHDEEELVEREVRDRFRKMCEGYFDIVAKKLVIEHKVRALCWLRGRCADRCMCSASKSRTAATTRRISARARYLRIASRRTRR